MSNLSQQLHSNKIFKIGEILLLFGAVIIFVMLVLPMAGDHPIYKQLVVWLANILMLCYVWLGLKLRGENWSHFGLKFKPVSSREAIKIFLLSVLVMIIAMTGFIIGSIIMANITGIPENANMSGYDYLKDNVLMLMVTLAGVYIVSSFGEEVIYRGFLINRIKEIAPDSKAIVSIAIILSSVIFGLIHYEWGPMGMVQTGFMGLGLAICYVKLKKRLWIIVLAHAYMDTILIIQMYLASNAT